MCIHCNGLIKVSSTENKVREMGGKSATQLVLQCERMGCNALPAALHCLQHFSPSFPFVHSDLILCLDFILIIFIFGLISISFLKADNYTRLYLKQADLIRLTPGYLLKFLHLFLLPKQLVQKCQNYFNLDHPTLQTFMAKVLTKYCLFPVLVFKITPFDCRVVVTMKKSNFFGQNDHSIYYLQA